MDVVKSGYVKRYSKSVLSGGWNQIYLTLHRDTQLNMYKKQGEYSPQLSICMKDVCKYFAYGEYTNGMPNRPDLPSGSSIKCLMGIPTKPSGKAKIIWFLFHNETELHEWMTAICNLLPPPPKKEHSSHTPYEHHLQYAQPVSGAPPPAMSVGHPMPVGPPPPGGQPPALGFENLSLGPSAAQPPYQPYPSPTPGYPSAAPPAHYPAAPPPAAYPAAYPAAHPQAAYPTQPYQQYPAAPYSAAPYSAPAPHQGGAYYPAQAQGGYVIQPGYPQQGYRQPNTVVYQQQPVHVIHQKKKGGLMSSNTGQMAAGLAGGALLGYGASRMMGGGWGLGRWGSWSSLSSFGSCGSFGSFSSFGSFG